jgi:acyl-CoA synthetase (AMP-forming)/AMP-acid ligase II
VPGRFVFDTIPRTATGKIRKFELREQVSRAA